MQTAPRLAQMMSPANEHAHNAVHSCMHGEQAEYADERIQHILETATQTSCQQHQSNLVFARLIFWAAWHDCLGLWITPHEKQVFLAACQGAEIFADISSKAIADIINAAKDDADRILLISK